MVKFNMSDLLNKIKERRSIRKYKSDMVPRSLIDQVIEAGLYAASGKDKQSTIIVAITNKEQRDLMMKANAEIHGSNTDPFYGAPVILLVLADKTNANYVYDGSLVMGNLMLAAHELGLGSCWIHRARQEFEQPYWQQWLKNMGINGEYEGIGHCALGYIDGDYPKTKPRHPNRVFYVE
jgi:nitroreductase